jgi:predicted nucleic acid-binding protein
VTTPRSVVVVDASAVVALLVADAHTGGWVADQCADAALAAPEVLPFEVGNALRRLERSGSLEATSAALAHRDLLALSVQLWPYQALAVRAWELRHAVTIYDAIYVALAEALDAPLITVDARLTRANGPQCAMHTPGAP